MSSKYSIAVRALKMDIKNDYERLPGDIIFPNYFMQKDVLAYHYLIKGSIDNMKATCLSWINPPMLNNRFLPLVPYLLVSFQNATCYKGTCLQQGAGLCREYGCTRNFLLGDNGEVIGSFPFKLVSVSMLIEGKDGLPVQFSPYIFCSDGIVQANFRELLGGNALFAEISMENSSVYQNPSEFACLCKIKVPIPCEIPPSPGMQEPWQPMVELKAADPVATTSPAGLAADEFTEADALAKIRAHLVERFEDTIDSPALDWLTYWMAGKVNRLTMRQFRGTPTADKAIVQSIQSFDNAILEIEQGGFIQQGQALCFPEAISSTGEKNFPIHSDLGLSGNPEILVGLWLLRNNHLSPKGLVWSGIPK